MVGAGWNRTVFIGVPESSKVKREGVGDVCAVWNWTVFIGVSQSSKVKGEGEEMYVFHTLTTDLANSYL